VASAILFDSGPTADGRVLQWRGRNHGHRVLEAATSRDHLLVFDADNQVAMEQTVTRHCVVAPGASYDSFSYIVLPDGTYTCYLTVDHGGDGATITERQRDVRFQVVDDYLILY
jgi:hypothetical protein